MELVSRDRSDFLGAKLLNAEVTSDLCVVCKSACEEQCLKYEDYRWHLGCVKCSICKKSLTQEYDSAGLCQLNLTLHCSKCSLSRNYTVSGVVLISQLEQYVYLLRVALQRLYVLLNVNGLYTVHGSMMTVARETFLIRIYRVCSGRRVLSRKLTIAKIEKRSSRNAQTRCSIKVV